MKRSFIGFLLIVITAACVDRINFDVGDADELPVVIEGYISDQPGPYEVRVTRGFDVESKNSFKTALQVRKLEILDDAGNSEELTKITDGVYQTHPDGIRGVLGRTYTLRVQLLDGRVYESIPEKILPAGFIGNISHNLISYKDKNNFTRHGFDIFFDSQASTESYQYLWKMVATYQVTTNPELATQPCGQDQCPTPPPCSGYIVGASGLEFVKPCECCNCWVDLYNDLPVVSDGALVKDGGFHHIKVGHVPIDQWTFSYKTHVEVQQFSLSNAAFEFWTAVKLQKEAIGSVFQPLTGEVPNNFVQVGGKPGAIEGIFYAASVSKNSIFLTREDIPDPRIIPTQAITVNRSCLTFRRSTNIEPDYWRASK